MACNRFHKLDVSPGFVAFLCAYYYFNPMNSFVPFIASLIAHEIGHLIALRLCGAQIHTIRFTALGAVIVTQPLCYQKELIVAASGPLTNAILLAFSKSFLFALMNLCLLVYNLLPIYPLDGGRILRALLALLLPPHIAQCFEQTVALGLLCALVVFSFHLTCILHVGLWPILVTAMLILRVGELFLPQNRKMQV